MLLASFIEHLWPRVCGVGVIIVAFVWARRRHIDVELEGEPPSFAITGRAAMVAAILAAAFGFVVMMWPEWFSSG
jgi:hypothetical protein